MKTIIANWKSNKNQTEITEWLEAFKVGYKPSDQIIVIAPSAVGLPVVSQKLQTYQFPSVMVGVQDLSPFPAGSYTGAISTKNLEGLNVKYALVGHSERRRYFHETYQEVANKVEQALQAGIKPVVCVDQEYIAVQMSAIPEDQWSKCIVAYEPVAAIGSGNEEPLEKVTPIITNIQEKYHPTEVYYGGSVSSQSVAGYLRICDGVIVATHSLDVSDFLSLLVAT